MEAAAAPSALFINVQEQLQTHAQCAACGDAFRQACIKLQDNKSALNKLQEALVAGLERFKNRGAFPRHTDRFTFAYMCAMRQGVHICRHCHVVTACLERRFTNHTHIME